MMEVACIIATVCRILWVVSALRSLHHLVQQAHQGGQFGENGLLVELLGAGPAAALDQPQGLGRGLMELLVQGLDLAAQGLDRLVLHPRLVVQPLAQSAGRGVLAAGELRAGIEGVAEVGGPPVVGRLGGLNLIEHGGRLGGGLFGILDTHDIDRHCDTEQKHGSQCQRYPDSHHLIDAFAHGHPPLSFLKI